MIVSVIVPVYNTEKYLKRCLNSLINQTYKELEIIIVNDASTDKSDQVINDFLLDDPRVKCIRHPENRGLFQARITGVQASSGDYVAFVDSDDYVSIDWFRLLVQKAAEENADITVGEWCYEYENGIKEYLNLDPFRIEDINLDGDDVIKEFMCQEGRCFSWHVVWNKLYAKRLWLECENDFVAFSKTHGHMLMWEDVAFSSGFWNCAKKVVNIHGADYYYYIHQSASTAKFSSKNKKRGEKYIRDSFSAMNFMKEMLFKYDRYPKYKNQYENWMVRCKATVYKDLVLDLSNKYYLKLIEKNFGPVKKSDLEYENLFYELRTPMDASFEWLENIKISICSEYIDIISFDVFDTLIQRPFCEPTNLFDILSDNFNVLENTHSFVDFKSIRISAEKECRKRNSLDHPSIEEITLDQIYEYILDRYAFKKETLVKTEEYEKKLELHFCRVRNSGKDLYDLAQYYKKKIIICSDMYLSKETIEEILHVNGYHNYNAIYVSSDIKLTKHTGHIFDYICKDLGISHRMRKSCMHIGDNWDSDVIAPQRKGWKAGHLAKSVEVFKGLNPGIFAGNFYQNVMHNTYHLVDTYWAEHDFAGLSCVFGIISNKLFDNPFVSLNRNSDFNMNPYTIGYLTLGPHLLALVQWIENNRVSLEASKVHFVARDGYLVKKAYDIFYKEKDSSNYLRLSRKSLILADVESVSDLYSIIIKANITNLSPKKMEVFLQPILIAEKIDYVHKKLQEEQIIYDRKFASEVEYHKALKTYIDYSIDITKLANYKKDLRDYFSKIISPGDILFDVGYSGRPEAALSNILGYPVNSLYIHTLKDIANKRQKHYSCICKTFYDYKPAITGVMREHLLMELGPSTIGYKKENGSLLPIFEEYKEDFVAAYVTKIIQGAALDFITDFYETFNGHLSNIYARGYDLSLPFEYFLHNSKEMDRRIFSSMKFEDDMGEGKIINALDFWNNEISQRNLIFDANATINNDILPNLYADGLFVKSFRFINQKFPYGSRQREMLKKVVRFFVN